MPQRLLHKLQIFRVDLVFSVKLRHSRRIVRLHWHLFCTEREVFLRTLSQKGVQAKLACTVCTRRGVAVTHMLTHPT